MQMTCNMSSDNPRFKLYPIPDGPEKALGVQFEDLWLQPPSVVALVESEYNYDISDRRFDLWKSESTYFVDAYLVFSFSLNRSARYTALIYL